MGQRVQCLIFVAYEDSVPDMFQTSPFQTTQVYALLPYISEHYGIHQILEIHRVKILLGPPFDSFFTEAIKAYRAEFFFIEFYRETMLYPWIIEAPVFSRDIAERIFRNCIFSPIDNNLYFFGPNNVFTTENLSIIKELGDIRFRGKDDGTFLHFAIEICHVPLVRSLLERGADVNARTFFEDRTPLHVAAYEQSGLIVSMLLGAGADVNAPCITGSKYDGATPLHLALLRLQKSPLGFDVVEVLLDNGADVNAESRMGNILQMAALSNSEIALRCVISHHPDMQKLGNQDTLRVILGLRLSTRRLHEGIFLMLQDYGCTLNPTNAKNSQLLAGATARPEFLEDLLKWGAGVHYYSKAARNKKESQNIVENLLKQAIQDKRCTSIRFLLQLENSCAGHVSALKEVTRKNYLAEFCLVIAKEVLDSAYVPLTVFFDSGFRALFEIGKDKQPFYFGNLDINDFREHILKHVQSLKGLNLKCNETLFSLQLPSWMLRAFSSPALQEHEAEVIKMRNEFIAESTLSYYDILKSSVSQIVRFLRNTFILETLQADNSEEKFPLYFPIISWRLQKAYYRKTLVDEGMKMFNFLFKASPMKELPIEIKEDILDYLSNVDLLILVNVCELPEESS